MIVVGINAYHPDAAVALIKDGRLVWAAEEERFNRLKHASGFPALALRQCLKDAGIKPGQIDAVAISKDPGANLLRKSAWTLLHRPGMGLVNDRLKALRKSADFQTDFVQALGTSSRTLKAKFIHVEHHQAHAASCFFVSGFDRAAFLSIDGLGDFSSAMWGAGEGNRIQALGRVFFPHSAGFLYTAATQFIGFHNFGDEYKVMGLAAYGKPTLIELMKQLVKLKPDGKFELNLDFFLHQKGQSKVRWEGGYPEQDLIYSEKWAKLFGQARRPKSELTDRDRNLAASLQVVLEEIYFHVLNNLYEKTRQKNLCLAGGVAFNSVANGKIKEKTPFENIYIQPAAGDAGTAVGAALYAYHSLFERERHFVMDHAYFGTEAKGEEIENALKAAGLPARQLSREDIVRKTVDALAEGKIVGWFQGRMEFGPRALGNRSILADPRRPDMKDILNKRIKHRETFRPFAPAVIEEKARDYFDMDCAQSPFMLKVFNVKPDKKEVIPAITHEDGTARVQTVSRKTNPAFWELLKAFSEKTGVPVLLNTSFNENEPVVRTPEEAISCFLKTKMDMLVLGNYLIEKGRDL